MAYSRFGPEYQELARIDFLLNELARAVERGEIPRSSYDALAPRHLARRREIADLITGAAGQTGPPVRPAAAAAEVAAVETAVSVGSVTPAAGALTADGVPRPAGRPVPPAGFAASERVPVTTPAPRAPVGWTTILTILGAFLVVVAAAIFAIVVWDLIGVGAKIVLMLAATVAFYGAGVYVRRLGLASGGVALTAVGSAMLLFTGWIAISGYGLQGPIPWAVLLLICSAVYWLTEVSMAGGFFGVVGASAQIGWWWLLGEGLGLSVPVRLAAIAVVAVAWQLAAERGRNNDAVGSLSRALEWAAPLAVFGASMASVVHTFVAADASPSALVNAAVLAGAAAVVMMRSRLISEGSALIAAGFQTPLFVAVAGAMVQGVNEWAVVAVLGVSAIVYALVAVLGAAAFSVPGMIAEAGLAWQLCRVLDASDTAAVIVLAALAVTWGLAALLARRSSSAKRLASLKETGTLLEAGSLALLVLATALCVAFSAAIPLTGVRTPPTADVVMAFGVLVAWWLRAALSTDGIAAYAGSVWSFWAVGALLAWWRPDARPEFYTVGLVLLAGVWALSAATPLKRWFVPAWSEATAVSGRIAVPLVAVAGTLYAILHQGLDGSLVPMVPLAVGAAVLAVEGAVTPASGTWVAAGFSAVLATIVGLASREVLPATTLITLTVVGFALGAPALAIPPGRKGRVARAAFELAVAGVLTHAMAVLLGVMSREWAPRLAWYALGSAELAVGFSVLGVHVILQSARRRFEPGYHAGGLAFVLALWTVLDAHNVDSVELYSTSLALYAVAAGVVHWFVSGREDFPVASDAVAVLAGLGAPLAAAWVASGGSFARHALWALGLAALAIGAGVAVRSRWYFFGGVATMVAVTLYRSLSLFAGVWWLLLGVAGVLMLFVALTWERMSGFGGSAREAARRSFENWR